MTRPINQGLYFLGVPLASCFRQLFLSEKKKNHYYLIYIALHLQTHFQCLNNSYKAYSGGDHMIPMNNPRSKEDFCYSGHRKEQHAYSIVQAPSPQLLSNVSPSQETVRTLIFHMPKRKNVTF